MNTPNPTEAESHKIEHHRDVQRIQKEAQDD